MCGDMLNEFLGICFVSEVEGGIDFAVAIVAHLCHIGTKPHYIQSCWALLYSIYPPAPCCTTFQFSEITDAQVVKKLSTMDTG